MKRTILFLQSIGVDRSQIRALISKAGIDLIPVWAEEFHAETSEDVFVMVTVNTPVGPELFKIYRNARMISVAFTGYDCIDIDLCQRRGIAVYNVPAYSTDSVAELTLGNIIALQREIIRADHQIRNGQWGVDKPGSELAGKKIGIIGTGSIGTRVAELFKAFKCEIFGWSRTRRDAFRNLGGEYLATMENLCSQCDIISIHLPLTQDTRGIIDERILACMPRHAFLINTSRAAIVDQKALAKALENRIIAGAALDVFDPEPISPGNPLLKLENALLTPHIGYMTYEALVRRAEIVVANIKRFLGNNSLNRVA